MSSDNPREFMGAPRCSCGCGSIDVCMGSGGQDLRTQLATVTSERDRLKEELDRDNKMVVEAFAQAQFERDDAQLHLEAAGIKCKELTQELTEALAQVASLRDALELVFPSLPSYLGGSETKDVPCLRRIADQALSTPSPKAQQLMAVVEAARKIPKDRCICLSESGCLDAKLREALEALDGRDK